MYLPLCADAGLLLFLVFSAVTRLDLSLPTTCEHDLLARKRLLWL
jgi:hypothetical protein